VTDLKKRILVLRNLRYQEIRARFPGQSPRWSRFQAKTKLDMELAAKRRELAK